MNDTRMYYFEKVYEFLEKEGDLYTLKELYLKKCELSESVDIYTVKWLKNKLKEKYWNRFFAQIKGPADVVCFKDLVSYLVNEKWYTERKTNTVDESKRIIQTAAKIIVNDIRSQNYETDYYPTTYTI